MTVTLYDQGVTNANPNSLGAAYPAPDPTRVTQFFDDFYGISADVGTTVAEWRVLGSTPVAPLITNGPFGRLTFAPAAGADSTYIQYAGNRALAAGSLPLTWSFVLGRDVWFQTLFQISDASLSVINAGLFPSIAAAGDPGAAADGVFFTKASGSSVLTLTSRRTAAPTLTLNLATLVAATDIKVGFHYSAKSGRVCAYVNDQPAGSLADTSLPTVGLIPLIGHGNNTAARTSSWDYVFAGQARQVESGS
jgi:hypothetical protein